MPSAENANELPLGALLERRGWVTSWDVTEALEAARAQGKRLGQILVEWELVGERDLALLVAEQEELTFIDLGKYDLEPDAVALVPRALARKYGAIPFMLEEGAAVVAIADPTDGDALEAVRRASARRVRFVVATRSEIESALAEAYGGC